MLLTDIDSNIVYFSEWVKDFTCYDTIIEKLTKHQIKYALLPHTRDYWVRDFMPIQISDSEFIQYKYNPNYLQKEQYYITNPDRAYNHLSISTKRIDVVLDGGNIVKCSDCIIMTDKVFIENSHLSKIQLINMLENLFRCEIVFIPWDRYEKYGHADGMVRYIDDRKVLLNNYINFDKSLRSQIINVLQNKLADWIERYYSDDFDFDLLSGGSGTIIYLLKLYDRIKEERLLLLCKKIALNIIRNAIITNDDSLSWITKFGKTHTGFSHGTSGIAFSLFKLNAYLPDEEIKLAAIKALNFELK